MHRPHDMSIGEKWQKIADETRTQAHAMPPSEKRDDLLKKARRHDAAGNLNNSLSGDPKTTATKADVK